MSLLTHFLNTFYQLAAITQLFRKFDHYHIQFEAQVLRLHMYISAQLRDVKIYGGKSCLITLEYV